MIELEIQKAFGTVKITAQDDRAAITALSLWTQIPDCCPICNAAVATRQRRVKDKWDYYELICGGTPRHSCDLGQYTNGGLFYKADWALDQVGSGDESTSPDDQTYASPETRGRLLADGGFVGKGDGKYIVTDPKAGAKFEIVKNAKTGRAECTCSEFQSGTCGHVQAVIVYTKRR